MASRLAQERQEMSDDKTAFELFDEGKISYATYKVLAADEEYERKFGEE